MTRPLFDSEYLYGFHDPGGEHIMTAEGVPGWVLVTQGIGHDPANFDSVDFTPLSNQGLGVMVRLNNGYGGAGTIPFEEYYDDFAARCANYVRNSAGARIWIIGNEPNHPIEWPGAEWDWNASPPKPVSPDKRGQKLTPQRYSDCYRKVRKAIHEVPGHADDQVLVAGVAPWNILTTYPGNEEGDWVLYLHDVLELLGPQQCDGITIHTYTHGTDPSLIRSNVKVGDDRFSDYHWHFRAYRDFMQAIPETMQHLPVYITETDQGDEPWRNENTGWVKDAYGEIDDWNQNHTHKIRSLILYRWPRIGNDRWYIEGKEGVIEDFRDALAFGYRWTTGPIPDDDRVKELWKWLEVLESQAYALDPQIRQAVDLNYALQEDEEALQQLSPVLDDTAELLEQLSLLQVDVVELEMQLEALTPIVPPGAVERPQIVDVMADLPQHESERWQIRGVIDIGRIVVHHTVTRTDVPPAALAQAQVNQGKPGIAYHFLIIDDGTIYAVQPLSRLVLQHLSSSKNHAVNADSIAIALAGDFRANRDVEPSESQRFAAASLIAWLLGEQRLGTVIEQIVFGRNELGEAVTSPGTQWLNGVRYKDKLFTDIQSVLDGVVGGGDAEELARLRARVAELEREVAHLETLAAQVVPLQEEVNRLQEIVSENNAEIARLQEALDSCAQSGSVRRPPLLDVVDELPHHPTLPPYENRAEPVTRLIIHHTDTPTNFAVDRIAHYHVYGTTANKEPWPGIGYHYVITADGTIHWTQRHETHSYHAGPANSYSIGVALIGRFLKKNYDGELQPPEDQLPTALQMQSASHLCAWLMQEMKITAAEHVVGHKEVSATSCPGDQWKLGLRWKDTLHELIIAQMARKPVLYYLLFWDHGSNWAQGDWYNAQNYIAHFRPTTGFSVADASLAQHVVVVGGPAGVSGNDEALLRAAGCEVYRLAGATEEETKAMLDELVANNTPWPQGPATAGFSPFTEMPSFAIVTPEPDPWTIPANYLSAEEAPVSPRKSQRLKVEYGMLEPAVAS